MHGVEYIVKKNKYRAYIVIDGKKKVIGTFPTEYEASVAYDMTVIKIFGRNHSKLNNPVSKKIFSNTTLYD